MATIAKCLIFVFFLVSASNCEEKGKGLEPVEIADINDLLLATTMKANARKVCPAMFSMDVPKDVLSHQPVAEKIKLHIHFTPRRLADLEHGEMKLQALFHLNWTIPTCPDIHCGSLIEAGSCESEKGGFYVAPNEIWSPKFIHINALANTKPFDTMPGDIRVNPVGMPSGSRNVLGNFATKCSTETPKRFPFDYAVCEIVLDTQDWRELIEVSASVSQTNAGVFVEPKTEWFLFDDSVTVKVEKAPEDEVGSRAKTRVTFAIRFQRNPKYYMSTMFVPMWAIFFLQLCGLFNWHNERYHYSMLMVVAYTIIWGAYYGECPKINEPVYAILMISDKICFSLFMTCYQILSTHFAVTKVMERVLGPKYGHRTLAHFVDLIVYTVAVTFILIMDICLFCLMNGTQNWD